MWYPILLLPSLFSITGAGGVAAGGGGVRFAARPRGAGVVVVRGRLATLDCVVANLGQNSVAWVRSRDLQILTHGDMVFTADSRVSVSVRELAASDGDARLTAHQLSIANLRDSDAGRYECQVNTEPKMSLFFHLTVLDEEIAEAVAEAAAEWAAERQPRAQSATEAMQRDEGTAGGGAASAGGCGARAALVSYVLALALLLPRGSRLRQGGGGGSADMTAAPPTARNVTTM